MLTTKNDIQTENSTRELYQKYLNTEVKNGNLPEANKKEFKASMPIIDMLQREYGRPIWEISADEFEKSDTIMKHSFTPEKIYRTVRAIQGYFDYGYKNEYFIPRDSWNHSLDRNYGYHLSAQSEKRANTFVPRFKVLEFCKSLVNPRDAFVILAFYEGVGTVDPSEVANLQVNDIHQKSIFVRGRNSRSVPVSEDLICYAKDAADATTYFRVKGKRNQEVFDPYDQNVWGEFNLADSDYVVRFIGSSSDQDEGQRIRNVRDILYKGIKGGLTSKYDYEFDPSVNSAKFLDSGKVQFILDQARKRGTSPRSFIHSKEGQEVFNNQFGTHSYQQLNRLIRKYDWIINNELVF